MPPPASTCDPFLVIHIVASDGFPRHTYNSFVLVSDFSYQLPPELIASEPLADRSASRMLLLDRESGKYQDRCFRDFPSFLRPDDLVIFNNTRVFPARLLGRRCGSRAQPTSGRNPAAKSFLQGEVEVLLTRQISESPNDWDCLVRPGRKIGLGERLLFGPNAELRAEVKARGTFGERRIQFDAVPDFWQRIESLGHIPLPPYIKREDRTADRERYQTVYASARGSIAAPTAGLHFTPGILAALRERGIETTQITLHVGLGTFQPVRVAKVEQHRLHRESYFIAADAAASINRALERKRRIVAIGTTTVRALEHVASSKEGISEGSADADLFIYPGFRFQVVGALLTNFHLPESTLLMMVSAFSTREHVLAAYRYAVSQKYRFYSYGDCMFLH
jgi:S-adenosylmethionine:tRNA ribosyltransferase-isomerase